MGLADRTFYPKQYLIATTNVFSVTLVVTWAITLIWNPHQAMDHPARPIIGSFNPCFGWDYPPASYFAVAFCSVNVYLTWRYAYFEIVRTHLSNPYSPLTWDQKFAKFTAMLLAIASNTWLLLWLIGPPDQNWNMHTAIFLFYAIAMYLAYIGNFIEMYCSPRKSFITNKHCAFAFGYTFASILIATCYIIDCALYKPGQEPPVPPWLTGASDWIWMFFLSSVASLTPPDVPLRVEVTIAKEGDTELGGSVYVKIDSS